MSWNKGDKVTYTGNGNDPGLRPGTHGVVVNVMSPYVEVKFEGNYSTKIVAEDTLR